MEKIIKLAITDFKIIFRDSSLRVFLLFPFILFGVVVLFLPSLVEKYEFLVPYLPLFLAVGVIENTQMFCFISSMVLIDEKETDVAKVYGITPLSRLQYIVSRFLIPYVITVALNVILLQVQPFYSIGLGVNLIISILTALIVPVYVLGINAIVENRMQGMVYVKAFNMIILIPFAAFFVPPGFKHLFGVFPTHWIIQSVDYISKGLSIEVMSAIGFLFIGVLLWFVSKQFIRKHFL